MAVRNELGVSAFESPETRHLSGGQFQSIIFAPDDSSPVEQPDMSAILDSPAVARPVVRRRRQQRISGAHFQDQAEDVDEDDEKAAFTKLTAHPKYRPRLMEHFEYDVQQKEYKERRKRTALYEPVIQYAVGYHQIPAVHQIEQVVEYAPHRNIEPFVRRDSDDHVRLHKKSYYSGMDGRAHDYLMVGPWIKLRLLKQTIHITVSGRPPQRAFDILGNHVFQQLMGAEKPRILMPHKMKRAKKYMLTVATPERLAKITEDELIGLLQRALRKKLHHVIYRQRNTGGPLFKLAKTQDTLY
jgi:hypothetical protein